MSKQKKDFYQPLFNHMSEEHGLTLTQCQLDDIIQKVPRPSIVRININQFIKVKLSDRGYQLLADMHNKCLPIILGESERRDAEYYKNQADADGYTRFQLREFMRYFGQVTHMVLPLFDESDMIVDIDAWQGKQFAKNSTKIDHEKISIKQVAARYGQKVKCKWLTPDGNDWLDKEMTVNAHFLKEMEQGSIKDCR